MNIMMYDTQGKTLGSIAFEISLDKKEMSPSTYANAVRVLRQNWRQGTVGCKSRGEVSFSKRKPWRQKGTGRARPGKASSPLWRKGGVVFGPQARTRFLSVNDKQKRIVFNNLFFAMADNKALHCLDFNTAHEAPTTKSAQLALNAMQLHDRKVVLFLSTDDRMSFASFRNLPNVTILLFDQPNAYDLSNGDCWLFLKKDMDLFKEMVERWN